MVCPKEVLPSRTGKDSVGVDLVEKVLLATDFGEPGTSAQDLLQLSSSNPLRGIEEPIAEVSRRVESLPPESIKGSPRILPRSEVVCGGNRVGDFAGRPTIQCVEQLVPRVFVARPMQPLGPTPRSLTVQCQLEQPGPLVCTVALDGGRVTAHHFQQGTLRGPRPNRVHPCDRSTLIDGVKAGFANAAAGDPNLGRFIPFGGFNGRSGQTLRVHLGYPIEGRNS